MRAIEVSGGGPPARCCALVLAGTCKPLLECLVAFFLHLWLGCGVTAQPTSSGHVAPRDVISNSVFLTLLSRGCGFCGRASKGALFAPVSSHDVMEMGGGCSAPNTWREVGNFFHFLFYFWLLIQYLASLPILGCSCLSGSWRESYVLYVCVKEGPKPVYCSCELFTKQGWCSFRLPW